MHRAIWIAVALALAAPAYSEAQGTSGPDAAKPGASTAEKKSPKKKAKKGAPADTTRSTADKTASAKKDDPDAAARASMQRARKVFMFAAESCQQKERCDPVLRDDAEQRFMDACQACGTTERCEADRAAIREGTAKRTGNPCAK